MKKIGTALFVCFSIMHGIQAQFHLAVTGGVQNSSIIEQNNNPGWDTLKNKYSPRQGLHFGFIADLPFSTRSRFYFQPGLIFSNKGRKFSASYDTSINTISNANAFQYINYMDVPLNLALKLKIGQKSKIIFGGGPYLSFFYNGVERTETLYKNGFFSSSEKKNLETGSSPGQYKNFDYGANAFFGFEFGPFLIRANYSRGFSEAYKDYNYEGTFRHQVMGASMGILMGKSKKSVPKPKDRDKDGIPDLEDNCPTESGSPATKGCPDKDADGIADKDDKCPLIPGLLKYGGCPVPDTDKDGINDEQDKCPAIAGLKKYNGCPVPDSDNDGVNDEEDKCPSVKGTRANNGCPETKKINVKKAEIKKEIVKKIEYAAHKIQFKYRSAKPLRSSLQILDEVAKILEANPELKLSIEGHTSNDGYIEDNMKLSQARANNVKKYLESKGIQSSRIKAQGFGPIKPLNSGKTPAQKALNRRVELKLSNQ